jgi:alpha-glucosidase
MKEFSRLAGQLGFPHHVIEGFWSRWSPDERRDVVEYSREQGVGLWFWKHSNQLRTPQAREEFFRTLHELGVVGAKIDFMDHEHKELVDLYEALLREAAEYRILVNFHGANKPTGRERTLPNDMVREAVKGMEASRLTDRARHQAILPFTRYLAGAADYTTMIFSERRGDTTWANQIASLVIFNSPLLTIAANPQSIRTNAAVDVIRSIPAVWDETIVLPGSEIGELAAFARRTGSTWFVAAMCGPQPQTIQVPLSFLAGGPHQESLVRDGDTDASVVLETRTAQRGHSLRVELRAGGGWVARFDPQ